MTQGVYMTEKELNRVEVLSKVKDKRLKQRQAAEILRVSLRQLQRLYKKYREGGAAAIVSKKRGKRSNNKIPESTRANISKIITQKQYEGFRPTLMCEKLEERHAIKISHETTRQIMISCGTWHGKKEKRPVVHQQRQRRSRAGELLQIDGSPHAWFEERGERCCLLVFIDDATGHTFGKFFESETTAGYLETMLEYIELYGAPLAAYSDKHSIFRINHGQDTKTENFTQFGRVLHELDIDLIYAHSPQAKGRVERANQTLQDRLIKEMRLARISTICEANRFLKRFWKIYNKKFSVLPVSSENAHRQISKDTDLRKTFCEKHQRKITKNLEFQFENVIYQVIQETPNRSLVGAKITVNKCLDGALAFEYKGKPLRVKRFAEQKAGVELTNKEFDQHFRHRQPHKPRQDHIWLQQGRAEALIRRYKCA